jgi:hypothetical protein
MACSRVQEPRCHACAVMPLFWWDDVTKIFLHLEVSARNRAIAFPIDGQARDACAILGGTTVGQCSSRRTFVLSDHRSRSSKDGSNWPRKLRQLAPQDGAAVTNAAPTPCIREKSRLGPAKPMALRLKLTSVKVVGVACQPQVGARF